MKHGDSLKTDVKYFHETNTFPFRNVKRVQPQSTFYFNHQLKHKTGWSTFINNPKTKM